MRLYGLTRACAVPAPCPELPGPGCRPKNAPAPAAMALAGALSAELGGAAKRRIDPRLPPRPGGAEVRNHVGIESQRRQSFGGCCKVRQTKINSTARGRSDPKPRAPR